MENQVSTPANTQSTSVNFMSVSEFKKAVSGSETTRLEILRNKKTNKLFASINGKAFKVQQDIQANQPISVLIPDGDLGQACVINATGGAESVFTL